MVGVNYVLDFSEAISLPDKLYEELYEHTLNGIEIYPLRNEVPAPWDSVPYVEGNMLKMDGGFGPSGYGSVSVELPKKDASNYYRFEVYVREDQEEGFELCRKMLEECGVLITKESEKCLAKHTE